MPLNKRSFRILYTSAALLLGICIVFILSLAGDKSHGPLEYVFSKLGSFVQDVENIFIVQKREDTRADKLSWLKQYKSNSALLKNPKIILPQTPTRHSELSPERSRRAASNPLPQTNFQLSTFNFQLPHVWHLFVIRTKERDKLQNYLTENGIQTVIHYPVPPHKQIAYKEWNDLSFPITETIHKQVLSLPISPVLTMEEVEYVVKVLNNYK